MNQNQLARIGTQVIGVGRALTGVFFLVAPSKGASAWVGRVDTSSAYLARAVGGRDLAIGAGALWALANDEDPLPWVIASVAGDSFDAAFGAAMLTGEQRKKAIVLAGGFGVLGAIVVGLLASADA